MIHYPNFRNRVADWSCREIVDESDVFIDVHKRLRRLNPAPKNRMPKSKIVTDPVDNAAEGEENLIDIDDSQQPTNQTLQRLISPEGVPESKMKSSSVELENSLNKPSHMPRRTSSLAGISDRESVAKRADTPEMRELLKHLHRGPSNLASRPRQTRYNTVKIKPGMGAVSESTTEQARAEGITGTLSLSTASQGGVGEGIVQSAGKDAKDGVHAVQVGYGSMDTPPRTPTSPNKFKDGNNGASKRPHHNRQGSSQSQSTVGSLPEREQSSFLKRGVRSGSITENIIQAGGFQKIVLETTSSSEENDKAVNEAAVDGSDDNRKENVKPNGEGQDKSGKKKRRRKRKKTSGEETPLLERDEA